MEREPRLWSKLLPHVHVSESPKRSVMSRDRGDNFRYRSQREILATKEILPLSVTLLDARRLSSNQGGETPTSKGPRACCHGAYPPSSTVIFTF
eukprot:scaffold239972_cov31-Tisochrysis_lutea.AAC.2